MGYQIASYLTLMSIAVSGVFAPSIHEMVAKDNREGLNNLYLKVSKIQLIILCCVSFGFLTCGKDFIIWWIGESRIDSYYVGTVLMLLSIGPLTMNASIEIQRAKNKHLFRAIAYFCLAIANIILSILFLMIFDPQYAIYACLTGTVITTICSHWIAMNIYNSRVIQLPIRKYLLNLLLYIVIGGFSAGIVMIMSRFIMNDITTTLSRLFIKGIFFTIIYLVICALINKEYCVDFIRQRRMK